MENTRISDTVYGLSVETDLPPEATQRAREELAEEGVGVLTEIDVRSVLEQKLDIVDPVTQLGITGNADLYRLA